MKYRRQSIRLKDYSYALKGLYYVTICTQNRELYFENNDIKNLIRKYWLEIPEHFKNVELDEWVIMPNHLHGIIIITDNVDNDCRGEVFSPSNIILEGGMTPPLQRMLEGGMTPPLQRMLEGGMTPAPTTDIRRRDDPAPTTGKTHVRSNNRIF